MRITRKLGVRVFDATNSNAEFEEIKNLDSAQATLMTVWDALRVVLRSDGTVAAWAGVGLRLYGYGGYCKGRELCLRVPAAAAAPLRYALAEELAIPSEAEEGEGTEALVLAEWCKTEDEATAYAIAEGPRLSAAIASLKERIVDADGRLAAAVAAAMGSSPPTTDAATVPLVAGFDNATVDACVAADWSTCRDWGLFRDTEALAAALSLRLAEAEGAIAASTELSAVAAASAHEGSQESTAVPPTVREAFARRAAAADDGTDEGALAVLSSMRFLRSIGDPLDWALRSAAGHGRTRTVYGLVELLGADPNRQLLGVVDGEAGAAADPSATSSAEASAECISLNAVTDCISTEEGAAAAAPTTTTATATANSSNATTQNVVDGGEGTSDVTAVLGAMNAQVRASLLPLHFAALGGHKATVIEMVRNLGADVEGVRAEEAGGVLTPLHCASMMGHADIIFLLVKELGARANAADGDATTALHFVAEWGRDAAVSVFAADEVADLFKEMVEGRTKGSMTPLMIAASKGHTKTARLLVEVLSADVRAKGPTGRCSVHFAAAGGFSDTLRALHATTIMTGAPSSR